MRLAVSACALLTSFVLIERACAQSPVPYHTPFYEIYTSDQDDRKGGTFNIAHQDSLRRQQLDSLILAFDSLTGWDCYFTAMVYHHGPDTVCSSLAIHFMKMAIAKDSTITPWLLAAAIDRHLNKKGELQIYGTQYIMSHSDSIWRPHCEASDSQL